MFHVVGRGWHVPNFWQRLEESGGLSPFANYLEDFFTLFITDSPPSADYLEELRMDRGRGGGEEIMLRNMMWVYKIAFMSIT